MYKILLNFHFTAFAKNKHAKICFLLAFMLTAAFITGGTILDRNFVADRSAAAISRQRQVRFEHQEFLSYAPTHPTLSLLASEVWILGSITSSFLFGRQPAWQEIHELELQRMRNILSAVNRWEAIDDGIVYYDSIHRLPYRFAMEFGSTEGLLQAIWHAETLLEQNIPPLTSPYEMSAFQLLYKSVTMLLLFLIPLLVFIFNGCIPTSSRMFLRCLPLSKIKTSIAGLCISTVIIWTFLVIVLALGFAAALLINGPGYSNFPLNQTQTVADVIIIRLLLMPLYIALFNFVELGGRQLLFTFNTTAAQV